MGDFKKCAYVNCLELHDSRDIDTQNDEYQVVHTNGKTEFFHKNCYLLKQQFLKFNDIWYRLIDKNVDFARLTIILKRMVFKEKRDMQYLIFALRYCIDHQYKLNYPGGFKYYIDREEIKTAYAETIAKRVNPEIKMPIIKDDSPKIAPTKKKKTGFTSIFQ